MQNKNIHVFFSDLQANLLVCGDAAELQLNDEWDVPPGWRLKLFHTSPDIVINMVIITGNPGCVGWGMRVMNVISRIVKKHNKALISCKTDDYDWMRKFAEKDIEG